MNSPTRQEVSQRIREFYDRQGWANNAEGVTRDAELNEDLREVARQYVSKCRLRVMDYISTSGEHFLDMASGPIQYKEYLKYSENFNKRHCVDLSQEALKQAEEKIGPHGEFHCGDFLDLDFEQNYFDTTLSCHTLYHIQAETQADVVRKLLYVTKPQKPVIIVYSNPHLFYQPLVKRLKKWFGKDTPTEEESSFYVHPHPIEFWKQFEDIAEVSYYPWRSFSARHQKLLFPNNDLGKTLFHILFYLERAFPNFFIQNFKFYTLVLKKRS